MTLFPNDSNAISKGSLLLRYCLAMEFVWFTQFRRSGFERLRIPKFTFAVSSGVFKNHVERISSWQPFEVNREKRLQIGTDFLRRKTVYRRMVRNMKECVSEIMETSGVSAFIRERICIFLEKRCVYRQDQCITVQHFSCFRSWQMHKYKW